MKISLAQKVQPILSFQIVIQSLEGTVRTHILSVYAPMEPSSDNEKDDFYAQLQVAIDSIPRKDLIIVGRDLNAHVGSKYLDWKESLGKVRHGL